MQFPKDYCLVEIDEKQNLKHEFVGADGETVTLTLDTEWNRMSEDFIPEDSSYIPHKGKIISKPRSISRKGIAAGLSLDELTEGDTVYINHLAVNPERKLTDGNYFLSVVRDMVGSITSHFIAKEVDGELFPVFDWNIFKPVINKYEHTTLIIPDYLKERKREDILEIVQPSTFSKSQGINPGDKLVVNPDAIYPIKIDDEDVWFVRNENILLRIL